MTSSILPTMTSPVLIQGLSWRLSLCLLLVADFLPTARAVGLVGYCSATDPLASGMMDRLVDNCASDRSVCAADTHCECNENGEGTYAASSCLDGCSYIWGEDPSSPITRATTIGTFLQRYSGVIPIFAGLSGLVHSYNALTSSQRGSLSYLFTTNIEDPPSTVPQFLGTSL